MTEYCNYRHCQLPKSKLSHVKCGYPNIHLCRCFVEILNNCCKVYISILLLLNGRFIIKQSYKPRNTLCFIDQMAVKGFAGGKIHLQFSIQFIIKILIFAE